MSGADDAMATTIIELFAEANGRLRKAVSGLDAGALDRAVAPETNSIAVLVAHCVGSQLDWLHVAAGHVIARDRDAEFRVRGKSAGELEALIERTAAEVPELVRDAIRAGLGTARKTRSQRDTTAAYALFHALEHLTEHVGQVELTRQLVTRG
jgi:uncharacterized damage-inducible protein DinB